MLGMVNLSPLSVAHTGNHAPDATRAKVVASSATNTVLRATAVWPEIWFASILHQPNLHENPKRFQNQIEMSLSLLHRQLKQAIFTGFTGTNVTCSS